MNVKFAIPLVLSLVACGAAVPTPKVPIAQAKCEFKVLAAALENDDKLVQAVMDGDVTLQDALAIVSAVDEQIPLVKEQLKACKEFETPVVAPPPAPGDKVM